ncbi:MAG: sugar ABC transporter permease [Verrucomicrobiae bacterium]|nr:sugar ABC transporter permease [Verrucomicrobiae bacterium]MDW8345170.1 sugar ABC transporter permease [Verrucomicrobiae bacterium]
MTVAERRNLRNGLLFCAPWLIGLSVFTAYPVGASLFYSFCDYSVLQAPVWCGLENYERMMRDTVFWLSLKNTLVYALLSLPAGMVVALSLALLLDTGARGMAFFRAVFYLPSIVPLVASAMLWLWIFNGKFGLLNWVVGPVFRFFGASPPAWLGDPAWAKPALALMSLWGVGNSMVIYLAGLQNVPRELYEAAEIDGARVWQRFWHVTLPMISPVIYFNLIMGIIGTLQVFTQVFVMTGGADGAPARSTLFYALYLFSVAFYDLRMGYASAMAWVLFLIIVALTWAATRLTEKRVHYGT